MREGRMTGWGGGKAEGWGAGRCGCPPLSPGPMPPRIPLRQIRSLIPEGSRNQAGAQATGTQATGFPCRGGAEEGGDRRPKTSRLQDARHKRERPGARLRAFASRLESCVSKRAVLRLSRKPIRINRKERKERRELFFVVSAISAVGKGLPEQADHHPATAHSVHFPGNPFIATPSCRSHFSPLCFAAPSRSTSSFARSLRETQAHPCGKRWSVACPCGARP